MTSDLIGLLICCGLLGFYLGWMLAGRRLSP
jgi:hypothetical protein